MWFYGFVVLWGSCISISIIRNSAHYPLLFQNKHIFIAIIFVAGSNDDIALLKAVEHFIEIRVLPTDPDVLFCGVGAIRGEDVDPVAPGRLVKSAAFDEDSFLFGTKLKFYGLRFVHA